MEKKKCDVLSILKEMYSESKVPIELPPPVFQRMKADIIEYDEKAMKIFIRFPVLEEYANPFGNMQGGMVAAAIDNTLGPLSMMHASKNYTRKLDIKFKKVIKSTDNYIIVEASIDSIKNRQLYLNAKVFNESEELVALAKAMNWML